MSEGEVTVHKPRSPGLSTSVIPDIGDEFERMSRRASERGAQRASAHRSRTGQRSATPAEMVAHGVAEEMAANAWWRVGRRSWG